MRSTILTACIISLTGFLPPAWADDAPLTKPNLVYDQLITNMPKAEANEVRVFTASFNPGGRTVTHTHRFPVITYVLEGAFRLELEGKEPQIVEAGNAFVVPPKTVMTGYNNSTDKMLKVVIFSVTAPDTPFLDPVK